MAKSVLKKRSRKKLGKKPVKKPVKKSTQATVLDSWATTEVALTRDLSEDLLEAWLKIREFAVSLGEQHVYASGKAIMFSKKVCYAFVRPKKSYLELVIFLKDEVLRPGFKSVKPVSKTKFAHTFQLVHSDQVEGDVTDAISEAHSS